MDLAYDHITEESLPQDQQGKATANGKEESASTLNADIQAAYTAISASASPWAAKLGGFWGNVVKQSESVYREAQQEVSSLGQDATKGLSDLRATIASRTRGLSLSIPSPAAAAAAAGAAAGSSKSAGAAAADGDQQDDANITPTAAESSSAAAGARALAVIKDEAAKRLRDLQKAEDAADEALLKFGSNLRDFLRDAITIAPPAEGEAGSGRGIGLGAAGGSGMPAGDGSSATLFESKDAQGKRVIHTSRFDAQLHVIHTNPDSFAKDPSSNSEFATWSTSFDIAEKTEDIAADLNKYPELRSTMEKLVPDSIPYADFWKRYYFLRHGIETAEARRRDLLKAASAEEEIGWDEDSEEEDVKKDVPKKDAPKEAPKTEALKKEAPKKDVLKKKEEEEEEEEEDDDDEEDEDDDDDDDDEDDDEDDDDDEEDDDDDDEEEDDDDDNSTDGGKDKAKTARQPTQQRRGSTESSKTIHPPAAAKPSASTTSTAGGQLKATTSPRKSNDGNSQADSEASYDMVGAKSGVPSQAASQAPNSPRETRKADDDSDEEDWE